MAANEDDWPNLMQKLGISKYAHQIESDDIIGKELASVDEWKKFYTTYSRLKGFSVRNGKLRKDKHNVMWQRHWMCSREGFREKKWLQLQDRKKTPKAITRLGCRASLVVSLDRQSNQWVATAFEACHNHELASPSEIQFLRSHRNVPKEMLAEANSMRRVGIRTMSILDYISMQSGGRDRLPFLKKDFYNKLAANRNSVAIETDSEGALGYLTCLAIRDGNFYCRFNVDEDDRLNTIFWADGTSRKDFELFGEVLAFDTTYRTNAYNKPLLIMVGVNHHFRTNIFGIALLADETTSTFVWVLQQFLDCMSGKHPKAVVTDGDHAMRAAINEVFPSSIHRLCAWHLDTNAGTNIPNGQFKIDFSRLMYRFYTEQEFEENWKTMVREHNLEDNYWVSSQYERRMQWAETFLRGNFFGGMRTTQRCESMNSKMRRFVESKHLLRDFVSQIDQCVQDIRFTEMQDDFNSKHTDPVIPSSDPLRVYYEQIADLFTRNIYNMIAKEIRQQNSYSIASCDYTTECRVYRLSRFRYGEIRHEVRYFPRETRLICGCLLMETDGIPCRHIFTVMKHLSIDRIPQSLLRPCWRKDAKTLHGVTTSFSSLPEDALESTRLGTLASEFNSLGLYASKFEDTFREAREQIRSMTGKFKEVFDSRRTDPIPSNTIFDETLASANNVIRDPIRAKTKGREKDSNKSRHENQSRNNEPHRKRCRLCNELGHNRATCKKNMTDTTPTPTQSSQPFHQSNNESFSQQSGPTIRFGRNANFIDDSHTYPTFLSHQQLLHELSFNSGQSAPLWQHQFPTYGATTFSYENQN